MSVSGSVPWSSDTIFQVAVFPSKKHGVVAVVEAHKMPVAVVIATLVISVVEYPAVRRMVVAVFLVLPSGDGSVGVECDIRPDVAVAEFAALIFRYGDCGGL